MTTADVTLKRFHVDPARRFESNHPPEYPSDESTLAHAAALLLGLNLRGWLSTRESDYLDSLAPGAARVVLVKGERVIHPNDIGHLPDDLCDVSMLRDGDAVFSRRSESARGACRVLTARIGLIDNEPIVFGMCGPDIPTDSRSLEIRFAGLLETFRAADRSVRLILDALRPDGGAAARILVNRASGRILHIDPDLCAAAEKEPFDFVSREYGAVEPLLRRLTRSYKMKMHNLSGGCLHIACLTFTPAAPGTISAPVRLHTSLVDLLLGEIAGVASSAEYIRAHCGDLAPGEIASLVGGIAGAGESLARRLARYRLLANFDRLPAEPVNLVYQLAEAVARFARLGDHGIILAGADAHESTTRLAPPDAYRLLFEAVIEMHRTIPGRTGHTDIEVTGDNASLQIAFSTPAPATLRIADLESLRLHETDRIAARLGVTLQRRLQLESNRVLTRLTVRTQEPQA